MEMTSFLYCTQRISEETRIAGRKVTLRKQRKFVARSAIIEV